MPIPKFTVDGVLPPFVGPTGPGGPPESMTPYIVSAVDVVDVLGTTDHRRSILRDWLAYRTALRRIGIDRGFQWLNGSFVEDKQPQDLDLVTFFYRPLGTQGVSEMESLVRANLHLFNRDQVKKQFNLDHFSVDMNGSTEALISLTRYFLGLFSHRRGDHLWKGMLQVRLESLTDELAATTMLSHDTSAATVPPGANL